MTDARKDAGQAQEPPRPPLRAEAAARPSADAVHDAGPAPQIHAETGEPEGETRKAAPRQHPRGMHANPWVKVWTSRESPPPGAPMPTAEGDSPAEPGAGEQAGSEAPAAGPESPTESGGGVDAGQAPEL